MPAWSTGAAPRPRPRTVQLPRMAGPILEPLSRQPDGLCVFSGRGSKNVFELAREVKGLCAQSLRATAASTALEAKLGYGFAVFGDRFTLTPEARIGLSGTARECGLRWRLTHGGSGPRRHRLRALLRGAAPREARRRHPAPSTGSASASTPGSEGGRSFDTRPPGVTQDEARAVREGR